MTNKIGILLSVISLSLYGITTVAAQCESIGQPKDFQISLHQDSALLAEWTADELHDDCNVTYSYSIYENDVLTQEGDTRHTQFVAIWGGPCTNTVALLYAKTGNDVISTPAMASWHTCLHSGFDGVTDITITPFLVNDAFLLVQWAPPTGMDGCVITYKVSIDGRTPIMVDEPELKMPSLGYCYFTTVSVVPVIGDVEGIAVSSVVEIDPYWLGYPGKLTVTIEDNIFTATWTAPMVLEQCKDLSYSYRFRQQQADDVVGVTPDTEVSFNITNFCPENRFRINVAPYLGNVYGTSQGSTILECP